MSAYPHDSVVPYRQSSAGKKEQVAGMFDHISHRYDLLNRLLSAGIDRQWRKKLVRSLSARNPKSILDVATGTGDVAILAWNLLRPRKVVGIDISPGMLEIGRRKLDKLMLNKEIELHQGDSEAIMFADGTFDAVTVAFGVRNFERLESGLAEIFRVLRSGGQVAILEFSRPGKPFVWFYDLYMRAVAPLLGKLFSRNKAAYTYLHSSVKAFPEGRTFLHILEQAGFVETSLKRLSLGICTIYCGTKPT